MSYRYGHTREEADRFSLEEVREATRAALQKEGLLRSSLASVTVAGILGLRPDYYGDRFIGRVIRELEAMTRRGEAVKDPKGRRSYAVYRTPERAAADEAIKAEAVRKALEADARMDAICARLAARDIKMFGHGLTAEDWERLLDAAGW